MKKNLQTNIAASVICIFLSLLMFRANAQIRTVIPADKIDAISVTNSSIALTQLTFNLHSLPPGSSITDCTLQLVCHQSIEKPVQLEILAADGAMIDNFRLKVTDQDSTIFRIKLLSHLPVAGNNNYTIKLRLDGPGDKRVSLYPSKGELNTQQGYSPQLILTYQTTGLRTAEWASLYGNGRHWGQSPMQFIGSQPSAFEIKEISGIAGAQQNLVMYNDHLYAVSSNENIEGIYAIDPGSLSARKIIDQLGPPQLASAPVVDALGRFYYVSGGSISVVELENNNAFRPEVIKAGADITAPLAIGTDGSVYLITNNSVSAYSSFPENKLIWDRTLPGKKSSVVLNGDGSLVYVVSYSDQTGFITTFDAANGSYIAGSRVDIQVDNDSPVPPAATIDNLGNIYITNKLLGATRIFMFTPRLKLTRLVTAGNNVSMPAGALDRRREQNEVTFFANDSLYRYAPVTGSLIAKPVINVSRIKSLVTDRSNNTYIIGKQKFAYVAENGDIFPLSADFAPDQSMVLGIDGTAYTATQSKIFAIKPVSYKDSFNLDNDAPYVNYDNLTFRGITLRVSPQFVFIGKAVLVATHQVVFEPDVLVKKTATVTIKTGSNRQGVTFKPGFKVEQGAGFVVKQGY
jgi:hypothetical protein